MDPIHVESRTANKSRQVQLCVRLTKAGVWASAKREPITGLVFCVAADPSLWTPLVWLRVRLRIVERRPQGDHEHLTLSRSEVVYMMIMWSVAYYSAITFHLAYRLPRTACGPTEQT